MLRFLVFIIWIIIIDKIKKPHSNKRWGFCYDEHPKHSKLELFGFGCKFIFE